MRIAMQAWVVLFLLNAAAQAAESCPLGSVPVGKCFSIEGSITAWNGNPTFRLRAPGARHLIGIHNTQDGRPEMPTDLLDRIRQGDPQGRWDKEYVGRYEVCPLAKERTRHMLPVCVRAAQNVSVQDRHR